MKTYFSPIVVFLLFFVSCGMEETQNKKNVDTIEEIRQESISSDEITVCGIADPAKNLPWLADLIAKAESVKTPIPHNHGDDFDPVNYLGQIWLEKYKGQDLFVTNMMLGSGGILYWFFDCDGNHLVSRNYENCTACQYVGNNHFFLDDDGFEDFQSFVSNMKLDTVIYSPF
jgi:hypothetical protein